MEKTQNSKSNKKILIVEDDLDMIEIYQEILGNKYDITMAGNTAEARAFIKADDPDLIILDLILPKEVGNVFLDWLRANPRYKNYKVLIVSVVNEFASEILNKYPGNKVNFVAKPFEKDLLIDAIEKML